MTTISITEEIAALTKRLAQLQDEAEDVLRQKLKEARAVVTELELQLSEITGRATASQVKAAKGFAPITDDQLEVQILFVLQKEPEGLNAVGIAGRLNQGVPRIRQWIKANPGKLRKDGTGTGTSYFVR